MAIEQFGIDVANQFGIAIAVLIGIVVWQARREHTVRQETREDRREMVHAIDRNTEAINALVSK